MSKYNFSTHLFRCSGLHHIMAGEIGLTEAQEKELAEVEARKKKDEELSAAQKKRKKDYEEKEKADTITEKQQETLDDIREKEGKPIPLTETMQKKYDGLIYKRDNPELTDGTKNYLAKLHREITKNRKKRLETKYIKKGLQFEEEAIDMYSMVKEEFFVNNKERIENEWLSGEYDIFTGKSIDEIEEGFDTKCSWDLFTFPYKRDKLNTVYYWQNMGYMFLSGAPRWTTVYCLIDTPKWELENIKYREGFEWPYNEIPKWKLLEILNNNLYTEESFFKMMNEWDCAPDPSDQSEDNLKAADIVNSFVPLSLEERIMEKVTERDEAAIEEIKIRVAMSREFMVSLEE